MAHLGDFGQRALRDEQAAALGSIDLLFVPVGGGPTIGAEQAAEVAARLSARIVVPMHYRTERIDFLEPVDAFVEGAARVERLATSSFEVDALPPRRRSARRRARRALRLRNAVDGRQPQIADWEARVAGTARSNPFTKRARPAWRGQAPPRARPSGVT